MTAEELLKAVRDKASRDGLFAEEEKKRWGEGVHAQALYCNGRASAFQDIVTFIDSGGTD